MLCSISPSGIVLNLLNHFDCKSQGQIFDLFSFKNHSSNACLKFFVHLLFWFLYVVFVTTEMKSDKMLALI